jgi:hypothetical protein
MEVKATLVCILSFASLAAVAGASGRAQTCGENAALRYWMALAQMENPDASSDLAQQLEKTARGQMPWDAALAPSVERNRAALATMHRGSRLTYCDWGLEWEQLGAATPIAQLPRLRALWRLNVLYGMYLLQQGKPSEAAKTWIAGIAFSRHIAAGTPLLGALMASTSLRSHFKAIELAITEKKLDGPSLRLLEEAVAALPEDGFDWSECVRIELAGLRSEWTRAESADDPLAMLSRDFEAKDEKSLASVLGLTLDEIKKRDAIRAVLHRSGSALDAMQPKIVAAFHLPLDRSITAIRELEAATRRDPLLAQGLPSFVRADQDGRGGVLKARADLLALLRTR